MQYTLYDVCGGRSALDDDFKRLLGGIMYRKHVSIDLPNPRAEPLIQISTCMIKQLGGKGSRGSVAAAKALRDTEECLPSPRSVLHDEAADKGPDFRPSNVSSKTPSSGVPSLPYKG
jgi:hypothetical protein